MGKKFRMFRSRLLVSMVFGCLAATLPSVSQGGSGKPTGGKTSVTASFREPGLGLDADRVDSDGKGTYVDKQDRVKAYIQSGAHDADFVLDLITTKGVRELYVNFGDCVAEPCTPPFAQDTVFFNTVLQTRRADLLGMPLGPAAARLEFGFWAPDETGENTEWVVRFDPLNTTTDCESSTAAITRLDASTWVIEADLNDVACLQHRQGSTFIWEPRGKYRMPLQVTVKLK